MAERKDSKGRILRRGEGQRPNGLYYFKYVDAKGKTVYAYSWTLTIHDKMPRGKRPGLCLREKEKEIQRDLFCGIAPSKMTVFELASRYVETRNNVRETTRRGYKTVLNFLSKSDFGRLDVSDVGTIDAREWLVDLQRNSNKSYSTIRCIRGVLRPAFRLMVDDGAIRRNPFDFELGSVLGNDSVPRVALTKKQERLFLDFVRNDAHFSRYYDAFCILFKTGMRVSELCGLTVSDVDFESGFLRIERQLQRTSGMRYYIELPKSERGKRRFPMGESLSENVRNVIENRIVPNAEAVVDGVSGFLFLDKNQMPTVALHWEKYLKHAVQKYNRVFKEEMPHITPHVCRHTFCTRMVRSGMSAIKLQYLMGHSDIATTYGVYTHLEPDDLVDERLEF